MNPVEEIKRIRIATGLDLKHGKAARDYFGSDTKALAVLNSPEAVIKFMKDHKRREVREVLRCSIFELESEFGADAALFELQNLAGAIKSRIVEGVK